MQGLASGKQDARSVFLTVNGPSRPRSSPRH